MLDGAGEAALTLADAAERYVLYLVSPVRLYLLAATLGRRLSNSLCQKPPRKRDTTFLDTPRSAVLNL